MQKNQIASVVFVIYILLSGYGCNALKGLFFDDGIAMLRSYSGKVHHRVDREGKWVNADQGSVFYWGDTIRTGEKSKAKVELSQGGQLFLGENSSLKFLQHRGKTDETSLRVETGAAEILGGMHGVLLETEVGLARIERGARIHLDIEAATMNVLVGSATVERQGAPALRIGSGDDISISLGRAMIDRAQGEKEKQTDDKVEEPPAANGIRVSIVVGKGVQIRGPGERTLRSLGAGEHVIDPETEIVTKAGATVVVARNGERAVMKANSRALVGADGAPLVNLQSGSVMLGPSKQVSASVPGGQVVAHAENGQARSNVSVQGRGQAVLSVESGTLDVKGKEDNVSLDSGETIRLSKLGQVEYDVRVPKAGDMGIVAGESITIHDPSPPTALRIRFGNKCSGGGMIEANSRGRTFLRAQGEGSALLYADVGTINYKLRCASDNFDSVKAQGTLRVLADAGKALLPNRAPKNTIEADGRFYTVVYQNLLPELTFRWRPKKGFTGPYTLRVLNSKGKLKSVATDQPLVSFQSGDLVEDDYEVWFQVFGNANQESPHTKLRVRFDNAAPSAAIRSPAGTVQRGAKVEVVGVVLEGYVVSIGGNQIKLDNQHRFRAEVVAPTDENTVAIRISHPSRGIHYYLRRLAQ